MPNFFYSRLAFSGIKKNAKIYIPYLITCSICSMMFYIMLSLGQNQSIKSGFGGTQLSFILYMGSFVIAVFSIIFLFYTYSFLVKRRQQEFGVYHALGMEKRHIAKMLFWETIITFLSSSIIGILSGLLFQRLCEALLAKLLLTKLNYSFFISTECILVTIAFFGCIFLAIFLSTMIGVYRKSSISLIKGSQVGEKEPKANWISAVLGVVMLLGGYAISVFVTDPLMIIALFLLAVLLVVIGTYLLFNAVSIKILRVLKSNKRYYYKKNHFIAVSGMLYRMKQNAVGLANICIFSTMVLVMLSSTVALFSGIEDLTSTRFPKEVEISIPMSRAEQGYTNESFADQVRVDKFIASIDETLKKHGIKKLNYSQYDSFALGLENGSPSQEATADYYVIIGKEDFEAFFNIKVDLNDNQAIVHSTVKAFTQEKLDLMDKSFEVLPSPEGLDFFSLSGSNNISISGTTYVITTKPVMDELFASYTDVSDYGTIEKTISFDTDKTGDAVIAFSEDLLHQGMVPFHIGCASIQRDSYYELFGGLFFLGIFLGFLFTVATVLILYYKQLSEGYDDQKRFSIMQKVGLSKAEVKSAIRSQVLTMFFLPLLVAFLHVGFAFPSIALILSAFNMVNITPFIISTLICALIFTVFYIIVFAITTKTYEKIVGQK